MNDKADSQFTESLKRVSSAAWQGLEYRFSLLAIEFQDEKRRLVVLVFLALVAVLSAFMAFLCLNVVVMLVFWNTQRIAALVILSVIYLVVAIGVGAWVLRKAATAPNPYAATLDELEKDRAAITGGDS